MSRYQKRRLQVAVLSAAGTLFMCLSVLAPAVFAPLSVLSWLGAVCTAGRLR